MAWHSFLVRVAVVVGATVSVAQSACSNNLTGKGPALQKHKGIQAQVVTNSLGRPRGIIFDKAGHLLVVDRGVGVKALTLKDEGGTCLSETDSKVVISDINLNHGIELSNDGKTLYASTVNAAFAWDYDPDTATVSGGPKTLVNGMYNTDHSTRTMVVSKKKPGTMIINRGSQSNIDRKAADITTGHGQVKAFDIGGIGATAYDFTADGKIMGWGIRNDVGLAEHPVTGGIWAVENSVDDVSRDGQDFHDRNPAEELNYFGTLVDNKSPNQGSNFGYPYCYAAWIASDVPNAPNIKTGEQFTIKKNMVTDKQCRARTAPRLSFDAHMAPLDIKFGGAANNAFVTFHGSHNRAVPKGFKVSKIAFKNGEPVKPSTSRTALIDLLQVKDKSGCPTGCFRPVGLAFDDNNRLFVSSDNTGEIYVLKGTPLA